MVKRILVLALALALLAAGFLYIRNTERAEQTQMQQMYQKISDTLNLLAQGGDLK